MTHMCPAHGDGLSGRNDSVGIGYYIESLYTTRAKFLPTAPPLRIESQLGAPTQGGAVSLTHIFFKKLASFHNLALHGAKLSLADAYGPCAQVHEADPWHADCPASLQVTPNAVT